MGILEAEARRLNESFAQYIRTGLPFVTLKAAMSLDGKIAGPPEPDLATGGPAIFSYITGESARRRVHEMRHASDAILVGVGTVIADDPLLTDRSGLPRRRPLMRVILDSRLRLPLTSRVVETANDDARPACSPGDACGKSRWTHWNCSSGRRAFTGKKPKPFATLPTGSTRLMEAL